ncbi:hypothetical protein ACIBG8_47030 [Nonomuraea sp. NPDC050556]|uniref:hypothetical protein n=1 Tax=Nonomuraea sp. NPDC050556 TaxID=3364369 RepID=UPI0037BB54C2
MTEIAERLRIATGFAQKEHEWIGERFESLYRRLRGHEPDSVDMELSIKDRDTAEQRATLELWVSGWPRLVATSRKTDLSAAVTEVRDDMIRQVDDTKEKREPNKNRHLREPLT